MALVCFSWIHLRSFPLLSCSYVSYLPLAHIYERANQISMAHFGVAVGFYQGVWNYIGFFIYFDLFYIVSNFWGFFISMLKFGIHKVHRLCTRSHGSTILLQCWYAIRCEMVRHNVGTV